MYLKSIILDGFKSYGTRTEILGFDKEFNAITGFNGSGKSNILDAICFVLGITQLGIVRIKHLQDFIFKQGKTGVTKASVTLTFDNTNKNSSPPNYTSYNEIVITRQVVMGGKSKYLLNGLNVANAVIRDLFATIQMNIENPHFLVMQGRITKVLNMKPDDRLKMIEEASGTGTFKSKKDLCKVHIEKKQPALDVVDDLMEADIAPKLSELKKQRDEFFEFKKVERELEHLQKVKTAWVYYNSKIKSDEGNSQLEKLIKNIAKSHSKINEGKSEIINIDEKIKSLQKEIEQQSGGAIANTQSSVQARTAELNTLLGEQTQNNECISDEKKRIKDLEKTIKSDENILKSKSSAFEKIESTFNRLKEIEENDKKELDKARLKYNAASAGLCQDEGGNEGTLQDKLMVAQRNLADAQLMSETIKKRIPHCESQFKNKSAELSRLEKDFGKDNTARDQLKKEMESLKTRLQACDAIKDEERRLNVELSNLNRDRATIEQKDARISFHYQDPEPGFCRSSVYGLVCNLLEVVEPKFYNAIEKSAGGRLFNVVVDTAETSRKLIDHGKLERRITTIPLNKISGKKLHPKVIQAAQRLVGEDNVWPALSLLRYDDNLQPAMEYIFGSTLICKDIGIARKVCYHPDIRTKCVALDGDTCDPSGYLSGGAQERTKLILPIIKDLKAVLVKLEEKNRRLVELDRQLKKQVGHQNLTAMKSRLDEIEDQLHAINARLGQPDQYKEEVNSLQKQIIELNEQLEECKHNIAKETKAIQQLQSKIEESNQETQLKEAEKYLNKCTAKANASKKEVFDRKEEFDSLKIESTELNKVISSNKQLIQESKSKIEKMMQENDVLSSRISEAKAAVVAASNELKSAKDKKNNKSKELTGALDCRDQLKKQLAELELDIKQSEKDHDKLKQNVNDCRRRVTEMLKEHDWISQEEQFFGKPNSVYDFQEPNPNELSARINNLKERKDVLGRTINAKAMPLLQKTEDQYKQLLERRQQVDVDKGKIMQVIDTLSVKREATIKAAFAKIDADFRSIFSSLLPGAHVQLEAINGDPLLGIDVRVGFGGKLKEDLSELSGGQRSLISLSLILAMLLYNPGPLYILDEVDAALDVSHTQNIGSMLKNHFKASQFLVVSLKDGMFSNANVLFHTRFMNGLSTVTRIVQNQKRK